MDIIPFEGGNLPAYLKKANVEELNNDLLAHAGGGFPLISIKGKVFAVVRNGERVIIPNPKDAEAPATSIDVVIVKASKHTSKVYYPNGYTEGGENVKPDCFSNDGIRPDPSAERPCATSCASCPKNAWGSRIGDNGKKGKACQDSVRIAIATPNAIDDPYMLRVPPASIRALGEYGNLLKKRGVGYTTVVTKIGFDIESPTPLLTFRPMGFIDEAAYTKVQEVAQSDVVQNILGMNTFATQMEESNQEAPPVVEKVAAEPTEKPAAKGEVPKVATKTKVVTEAEVTAAVATAQAKPAPKEEPKVVSGNLGGFGAGLDLSNLSFDD